MGPTSTEGVVDATGRVFNTSRGSRATHPGLYVTDTSIIPDSPRYNQH
jgi:choline dehydrogenase-like flavoprotein